MELETLSRKLKQARLSTGMSTRMVEIKLPARCRVSHATIANFEAGRSTPTMEVLAALADMYQRPLTWFLEKGPMLTGVRYRNIKSKVRLSDRHAFEGVAQKWFEAYRRIETWMNQPLGTFPPALEFEPSISPTLAASQVRKHFGLDQDDPVPSAVNCLEQLGVRAIELPTRLRIDALAARLGDENVVALNPSLSAARTRLNAAHELAHVVLRDTADFPTEDHERSEQRAFEFASHFLLTPPMLREAFKNYSMVRLVQFKSRYGISLAAMIYRAEREQGLLTRHIARNLWIEFTKRGWRQNEPGEVKEDRASRFEQLVDGAIIEQRLTLSQAASIAGVNEQDLHARIELAKQGLSSATPDAGEAPLMRIVN